MTTDRFTSLAYHQDLKERLVVVVGRAAKVVWAMVAGVDEVMVGEEAMVGVVAEVADSSPRNCWEVVAVA